MMTEDEEQVYDRYQELCSDLNLDSQTKEETWKTYSSVKQMYTLEVSLLACKGIVES